MLSIPDMAILGAFALLVFGPEQLPRVARKAGSVMRDIQNTSQSFIREMERAADVTDAASAKPYEPPPYDPAHYEPAPYDAQPYDDAPTVAFPAVDPPAPEPEAPLAGHADTVGEKLAEPRPAPLPFTYDGDGLHPESLDEPDRLPAAEPAPEADHPAHL